VSTLKLFLLDASLTKMQYSADVWADWQIDCTLQSVLNGGLSIGVTSEDPPFTTRDDSGGSALNQLIAFSGAFTNDIHTSFSRTPWGE